MQWTELMEKNPLYSLVPYEGLNLCKAQYKKHPPPPTPLVISMMIHM